MAEQNYFPQIPSTVWWGIRALLDKSPKTTFSEDVLGTELGVQPAAARQYISELRRVGILNEDNKATDLAGLWRLDESYLEAVEQLLAIYPEGLRTVARSSADRAKAVEWFKRQGLGQGAAGNKAATYFLIMSPEPGASPPRTSTPRPSKAPPAKASPVANKREKAGNAQITKDAKKSEQEIFSGLFPVNLNLQIHISADATVEQIDAIFASMRKHLGNARLS